MHAKSPQSQLSQLSARPMLSGLPKLPANTVPPFPVPSATYKACGTVMRRGQALLSAPNPMPSGEFCGRDAVACEVALVQAHQFALGDGAKAFAVRFRDVLARP